MGYVIALAGKGGTGKTTIACLIVRLLREKKRGSILAVDADPNSNFAENLGLKPEKTIGSILDDLSAHPEHVPASMSKDRFVEYEVQTAIQEEDGFDVLTMGRPEGPGCYCYVNNVLRNAMARLIKDYDYVVIDNEAGLEHLSRRTTRSADSLVVVSDATKTGLRSAARIKDIVEELEIKTKNRFLLINRSDKDLDKNEFIGLNLEYLGSLPCDEEIQKISLNGNSLMKLDDHATSMQVLRKIGDKLWS